MTLSRHLDLRALDVRQLLGRPQVDLSEWKGEQIEEVGKGGNREGGAAKVD